MSPLKREAHGWWALSDLNGRPFGCKPNALTAELSALTQFIVQEAAASVNARRNWVVVQFHFLGLRCLGPSDTWTGESDLGFSIENNGVEIQTVPLPEIGKAYSHRISLASEKRGGLRWPRAWM